MSRVGKNPVTIPSGVKITRSDAVITVKGPKGELTFDIHPDIIVDVQPEAVTVTRPSDVKEHRSLHGATRAVIQNMVTGVTQGFKRNLELVGVGYRAEMKSDRLFLSLGFSHQIVFIPPKGIAVAVPAPTSISIEGIDKQLVGAVAAKIRSFRPPEPYKGKGVKYEGEHIRRKAGKTAKS
ncbi:MAG: 50S ribosomal protein L6 [Ignavibacteriae bacterium]|nr:50S ribosomal protein L6 [Ignavibacteriota bacterium]